MRLLSSGLPNYQVLAGCLGDLKKGKFMYAKDRWKCLRSGLATSAAAVGQNERDIMTQTRHKSVEMVRRYIQKGTLFQGNVVSALDF